MTEKQKTIKEMLRERLESLKFKYEVGNRVLVNGWNGIYEGVIVGAEVQIGYYDKVEYRVRKMHREDVSHPEDNVISDWERTEGEDKIRAFSPDKVASFIANKKEIETARKKLHELEEQFGNEIHYRWRDQ